MRKPAEWMTPMDDRILEALDAGLILSPAIIAYNIGKSREAVGRRLIELADAELVERVDRGRYEITSRGQSYLQGELEPSRAVDGE